MSHPSPLDHSDSDHQAAREVSQFVKSFTAVVVRGELLEQVVDLAGDVEAEGKDCPTRGQPMITGTATAPWPQHKPPLVKSYYRGPNWSEKKCAYGMRQADYRSGAQRVQPASGEKGAR
jgi:hypothetical protein